MKTVQTLVFVAVIAIAGCTTSKGTSWFKPGATSEDFYQDRAQCNAQAFSGGGGNLMTIAIIQNQCLQGKGWALIENQ